MKKLALVLLLVLILDQPLPAQRPDAGIEQQVYVPTSLTVKLPPPGPPKACTEFIPYITPFSIVLFPVEREIKLPLDSMVPVYLGNVTRPYEIIGTVVVHDIQGPVVGSEIDHEVAIRSAANAAWLHGADALLLRPIPPMASAYYMSATAVRFSWRL